MRTRCAFSGRTLEEVLPDVQCPVEVMHQVLADEGHADFVIEEVRAAIAADPRVAGRLALWGRRLVGEALSQARRVAANREALTHLLTGTVDRAHPGPLDRDPTPAQRH